MKYLTNQIINILVSAVMLFFAVPKLLGKPQSVAGFNQFEDAFGIPSDGFRIFTGIAEFALATLFILFAFNKNKTIGKIAFGFLFITMFTALFLEFFARPEPKMMLVSIAIILIVIAIFRLKKLNNA
ncbi:DoxX family protein [Oceanihabitans sp. 2_MG-2023]|uniref:DoxX family protein n=1 Tax=Oceanihabitans sp. 2_MG-2023 TaxID=3062661 RepID=UPI0026E2464C|nr:DoxX family protein [Oceanihabitans sp. 2_MG-2023]MDO6596287.1 DoxX family protein [Oceanihabitans sp. 2_MG-2023]